MTNFSNYLYDFNLQSGEQGIQSAGLSGRVDSPAIDYVDTNNYYKCADMKTRSFYFCPMPGLRLHYVIYKGQLCLNHNTACVWSIAPTGGHFKTLKMGNFSLLGIEDIHQII